MSTIIPYLCVFIFFVCLLGYVFGFVVFLTPFIIGPLAKLLGCYNEEIDSFNKKRMLWSVILMVASLIGMIILID